MTIDLGILILRTVFGLAIAAHGAQKLFGWFGGYGLQQTGALFDGMGFRPGVLFAAAASLSEFGGGVLLVLGLITPAGAAAVLAAMLVAMVSVHLKNGFFAMNNGIELPFLYALAAVSLAFTGGGAFSLDARLGWNFLETPWLASAFIAAAVIGAAATLALRRQAQTQTAGN